MQKPTDDADGSNVIWVDFSPAARADCWFLAMANRCEEQARTSLPQTAAKLRRLADSYRERASNA